MSTEFVTLKRVDESFDSYLKGNFSKTQRAIPEKSLNVNTVSEQVTFKIINIENIEKPNFFILLFKLFRFDWLSLTLGPILACYSYLLSQQMQINQFNAFLSIAAVVFLHAAVFSINDYKDYLSGFDRISYNGGSQVIQRGWLSANQVKDFGIGLFGLGAIIGAYLVLQQPYYLIAVAGLTLISVLGYSFLGQGLKYLGFGGAISFLCFGPLLTYGFARSSVSFHNEYILLLGVPFGFLATLCFQSRGLSNIMADNQLGVRSLATRLGFDKFKNLLSYLFLLTPALLIFTFFTLELSWVSYFLLLPYTFFTYKIFNFLHGLKTSVSVELDQFKNRCCDLHVLLSTILVIVFWLKGA